MLRPLVLTLFLAAPASAAATPLINMHMNMSPVAQEVEKLRLFVGNLTE